MAAVVVPTSTSTLIPEVTIAAALAPIAAFSSAWSPSDSSNECSERAAAAGAMAPPRTRRTPWLTSRAVRSPRAVTSLIPKASARSATRMNRRSVITSSMRSRRSVAGSVSASSLSTMPTVYATSHRRPALLIAKP